MNLETNYHIRILDHTRKVLIGDFNDLDDVTVTVRAIYGITIDDQAFDEVWTEFLERVARVGSGYFEYAEHHYRLMLT